MQSNFVKHCLPNWVTLHEELCCEYSRFSCHFRNLSVWLTGNEILVGNQWLTAGSNGQVFIKCQVFLFSVSFFCFFVCWLRLVYEYVNNLISNLKKLQNNAAGQMLVLVGIKRFHRLISDVYLEVAKQEAKRVSRLISQIKYCVNVWYSTLNKATASAFPVSYCVLYKNAPFTADWAFVNHCLLQALFTLVLLSALWKYNKRLLCHLRLFQSKTFKNKLYGENDIPLMCVDHIYGGNNRFYFLSLMIIDLFLVWIELWETFHFF